MNQGSSSYGTISYNSLASVAADQSYKASITGEYQTQDCGNNRAQYGQPQADITSPTFGYILNTVNTGPVGTGNTAPVTVHAAVSVPGNMRQVRLFPEAPISRDERALSRPGLKVEPAANC